MESNLKLHYKDAQSEVKDLRNRIDELREYSDKVDDENRRLRKELEESKAMVFILFCFVLGHHNNAF